MLKGQTIYLVIVSWINDGEDGNLSRAFEHLKNAKAYMKTMYDIDLANYKKRWEEIDIDCAFGGMGACVGLKEHYSEFHVTYEIQQKIIN